MITEIASAVSNVFKVISQALGMAHDKEQRNEGATAQREATDEAVIDRIKDANSPVSADESSRLWNVNKAKFGVVNGGKQG